MYTEIEQSPSETILRTVYRRAKYFGRYGERFDRRLYSEVEAYVRIWLQLSSIGTLESEPSEFRRLLSIQQNMIDSGKGMYRKFP